MHEHRTDKKIHRRVQARKIHIRDRQMTKKNVRITGVIMPVMIAM